VAPVDFRKKIAAGVGTATHAPSLDQLSDKEYVMSRISSRLCFNDHCKDQAEQ